VLGRGTPDTPGRVERLDLDDGQRSEIAPSGSLPRWVP
jgi:hypothetical protein